MLIAHDLLGTSSFLRLVELISCQLESWRGSPCSSVMTINTSELIHVCQSPSISIWVKKILDLVNVSIPRHFECFLHLLTLLQSFNRCSTRWLMERRDRSPHFPTASCMQRCLGKRGDWCLFGDTSRVAEANQPYRTKQCFSNTLRVAGTGTSESHSECTGTKLIPQSLSWLSSLTKTFDGLRSL